MENVIKGVSVMTCENSYILEWDSSEKLYSIDQ